MKITPAINNGLADIMQKQQKLEQQLASGKRINKAADDAAGLQIANRLSSTVNAQEQGQRNLADGIAFARVYDQALQGINDNVMELERLTIAAGNGAYSDADRQSLQTEANAYLANIEQGLGAEFAGKSLFSESSLAFNAGDSNLVLQTRDLGTVLTNQSIFNLDLTDPSKQSDNLSSIRNTVEQLGTLRAEMGASINAFQGASNMVSGQQVATAEARARITELDYAKASSERAANSILSQSSINVAMQARVSSEQALSLLG